jgi:DNA mismatch endonuclease Vsr
MSAVRCRDTAPELAVRRLIHRLGYRYRLHKADLPGRPDLSFPARRKAIEVRGCFWHVHAGCPRASIPQTRRDWWVAKLQANVARDARNEAALRSMDWKVLTVWECQVNSGNIESTIRDFLEG